MHLEPLHPIQLQRLRDMTPQEKYGVFKGLMRTARQVRRAVHQQKHPDWTEEQIDRAVAQEFVRART